MILETYKGHCKKSKYCHKWRGLGLMSKKFNYGQLEPLL